MDSMHRAAADLRAERMLEAGSEQAPLYGLLERMRRETRGPAAVLPGRMPP